MENQEGAAEQPSELDEFVKADEATVEESEDTHEESGEESQDTEDKSEEDSEQSEEEGSTTEPEKETGTVPLPALLDEREKRQKAEREAEELRRKLGDEDDKAAPDPLEDAEGYAEHLRAEGQRERLNDRIILSQEVMREKHDDYDAAEARFLEMAKDSPSLVQQMNESTFPARFVYEQAKKAEKLEKLENVDEMEARLRAEIEEKVRKELTEEAETKAKEKADLEESITPSIAAATATGKDPKAEDVPDPLETTFNR